MKKSIRLTVRHVVVCALAMLAIASTTAPAEASPILTMTPSSASVSAGADFYVDVGIEGVSDLFGFGIVLTVDLTKATFRGTDSDSGDADDDPTNEGPFLLSGFDVDPTTFDLVPNQTFYYDQYLALDSVYVSNSVAPGVGVGGDGVLFRAFFTAGQNPGLVNIGFGTSLDVFVGLFDSTSDANGAAGVITPEALRGAQVNIVASTTSVPEPTTVSLVGLGVLAAWRRHRRAANKDVRA
jgi:hypothetical protein